MNPWQAHGARGPTDELYHTLQRYACPYGVRVPVPNVEKMPQPVPMVTRTRALILLELVGAYWKRCDLSGTQNPVGAIPCRFDSDLRNLLFQWVRVLFFSRLSMYPLGKNPLFFPCIGSGVDHPVSHRKVNNSMKIHQLSGLHKT
jgi:hypothetical protein